MSSESNPKSEQEMLIQHEPKELAKLFFMGGGGAIRDGSGESAAEAPVVSSVDTRLFHRSCWRLKEA